MKSRSASRIFAERYSCKGYIAFAFGILLFLGGCKSAKLQALENSVSTVELTTGREVRRSLTDDGTGFLGKPTYAEVLIVYEPIGNHSRQEVFEETGAVLKKNNWSDYGNASLDYSGKFIIFVHFCNTMDIQ